MTACKHDSFLLVATVAATAATATAVSLNCIGTMPHQKQHPGSSSMYHKIKQNIFDKAKSLIIFLSRVENRLIILGPTAGEGALASLSDANESKLTLLQIFPGINLDGNEYIKIGRAVQNVASLEHTKVVVAIGISLSSCHPLLQWALGPSQLSQMLQKKAESVLRGEKIRFDSKDSMHQTSMFQNIFVWGHSYGGFEAMRAALPSSNNGLILYGCSMSLYSTPQGNAMPDVIQNNLLSSYPRPVLTMMGERDGFLRWHAVAGEAHTLHKDSQRRINSSQGSLAVKKKLEEADELRKPVVILQDLNHMHMAMGRIPEKTAQTGRSDLPSPTVSLDQAHQTLTRMVVDFMHVHSNKTDNSSAERLRKQAKKRVLKQHTATETLFLGPFARISDRVFVSQFINETQRKLLHVTSNVEKFNFYDESDHNEEEDNHAHMSQGVTEKESLTISTNWHQEAQDFLYCKPRWTLDEQQLWLEAAEQDAISLCRRSQISKTLAFKGKTQGYILRHNFKFQAIKDSPAPTLMQLNDITFDQVLNNVVTPQQRQRYKKFGTELRFGPDILIPRPPKWVETPISLTRYPPPEKVQDNEDSYYLLQSPYVSTSHMDYLPPQFAGAWYGKPLSPAQAYEWIVFDAFKT